MESVAGVLYPDFKRGCSTEVKNECSYTSKSAYAIMAITVVEEKITILEWKVTITTVYKIQSLLQVHKISNHLCRINPLTPKDPYSGRTAPLTSKRFIFYIYATNIGTECFKHGIYCPFFLFKMQFVS